MDDTNANELIVSKLKTFRGDRGKVALDNEVTIQGDNQRIIVAKPYAPGRSTAVSGRPVFGKMMSRTRQNTRRGIYPVTGV